MKIIAGGWDGERAACLQMGIARFHNTNSGGIPLCPTLGHYAQADKSWSCQIPAAIATLWNHVASLTGFPPAASVIGHILKATSKWLGHAMAAALNHGQQTWSSCTLTLIFLAWTKASRDRCACGFLTPFVASKSATACTLNGRSCVTKQFSTSASAICFR